MRMFLDGKWIDKPNSIDVVNPFDGSVVDTVPRGDVTDVDRALTSLAAGAAVMRSMPAYQRAGILERAAELLLERVEDFGRSALRRRQPAPGLRHPR